MAITDQHSTDFIKKKLLELSTIEEMNKEIHSTMSLDKLLQIMVEKAIIGVNFERGLIYLLEDDFLRCVAFLDRIRKEKGSTIKNWIGFKMDETSVEVMTAKKRQTMVVDDALTDERMSKKFLEVMDYHEYCVVPLIGRTGVLGVLTGDKFYSRQPVFPEDIQALELFAGHISLAIENAKLFREKELFSLNLENKVKERTKELEALFEMSRLLSKSLRLAEVLDHILSLVQNLGHIRCAIHLSEDKGYSAAGSSGLDKTYMKIGNLVFTKRFSDRLLKTREPLLIDDLAAGLKTSAMKRFLSNKDMGSVLLVPLSSKGKILALLVIYEFDTAQLTPDLLSFFSAFAAQGGTALENAFMYQNIKDLSRRLEQENTSLKEKMKRDISKQFVVGKGPAMKEVMNLMQKVIQSSTTVIIYGETGTGKELIANAIHETGPRKNGPMIRVNCAAIPDELLESELFGHEKGAFTGADKKRVGMFQLADKGTIFLDEIGDISLKTQTKLLRVLQESRVKPLGAEKSVSVDVRVISATNKDLNRAIKDETFRSDLFYRLNVFPIQMPPLRQRKEDLEELVAFFLQKYRHLRHGNVALGPDVLNLFYDYPWPGNIRELENIMERLMLISTGHTISTKDLPKEFHTISRTQNFIMPMNQAVREFKINLVKDALESAKGKKSDAASLLGLPRSNFSRLLKQLELN